MPVSSQYCSVDVIYSAILVEVTHVPGRYGSLPVGGQGGGDFSIPIGVAGVGLGLTASVSTSNNSATAAVLKLQIVAPANNTAKIPHILIIVFLLLV